jgi:hypothetical protein
MASGDMTGPSWMCRVFAAAIYGFARSWPATDDGDLTGPEAGDDRVEVFPPGRDARDRGRPGFQVGHQPDDQVRSGHRAVALHIGGHPRDELGHCVGTLGRGQRRVRSQLEHPATELSMLALGLAFLQPVRVVQGVRRDGH